MKNFTGYVTVYENNRIISVFEINVSAHTKHEAEETAISRVPRMLTDITWDELEIKIIGQSL